MKKQSRTLILLTGMFVLSCQTDESVLIQQMIDQKVEERLQNYIALEKQRCKVRVLEEASRIADSLLRENPVFITLDSLQRPPVPLKPVRPEFERRKDSILIAPIIPPKDSIAPDTSTSGVESDT